MITIKGKMYDKSDFEWLEQVFTVILHIAMSECEVKCHNCTHRAACSDIHKAYYYLRVKSLE